MSELYNLFGKYITYNVSENVIGCVYKNRLYDVRSRNNEEYIGKSIKKLRTQAATIRMQLH